MILLFGARQNIRIAPARRANGGGGFRFLSHVALTEDCAADFGALFAGGFDSWCSIQASTSDSSQAMRLYPSVTGLGNVPAFTMRQMLARLSAVRE